MDKEVDELMKDKGKHELETFVDGATFRLVKRKDESSEVVCNLGYKNCLWRNGEEIDKMYKVGFRGSSMWVCEKCLKEGSDKEEDDEISEEVHEKSTEKLVEKAKKDLKRS